MSAPMDEPIAYMARTRAWYLALGYGNPYIWAHNAEVPFHRSAGPLAAMRVALVTTAAPFQPGKGDQGPGAPYNGAAKFHDAYRQPVDGEVDVRISHIAYDRTHTSARDPRTWFPLAALREAAASGRIAGLTAHFFGLPTTRSQRTTLERDAPALLAMLREDGAQAAVLVANCPVCHQSLALAARHLEADGIATVVMGCARDIVEHAGAPRFLFSDFPLGNAAGIPDDEASQRLTLGMALDLLEAAPGPGTTARSPLRWPGPAGWKDDYANPAKLTPEELARRRAEFDEAKAEATRTGA